MLQQWLRIAPVMKEVESQRMNLAMAGASMILAWRMKNLLLKAAEMGIGTLVMGIRDEKKLHEILSIPEEQMVVSVIGVGYGTVSPDMPKRKSVEDVAVIC